MPPKLKILLAITCLSFCLLVLFSCGPGSKPALITVPKDFQMTATKKEDKIPLRAALYINPVYPKPDTSPTGQTPHIEEAFLSGSERMLRNIFREVIIIGNADKKDYDVIVAPEILKWGKAIQTRPKMKFLFQMDIKWNIFSPEGKVIYFSTIKSEIEGKMYYTWRAERAHELEGFVAVLDDQLLKAQDDIYSNKWWPKK